MGGILGWDEKMKEKEKEGREFLAMAAVASSQNKWVATGNQGPRDRGDSPMKQFNKGTTLD